MKIISSSSNIYNMKYLKIYEEFDSVYDILYTLKDIYADLDNGYFNSVSTGKSDRGKHTISVYSNKGYEYITNDYSDENHFNNWKQKRFNTNEMMDVVYRAVSYMEGEGYELSYCVVNHDQIISISELEKGIMVISTSICFVRKD